jgi:shikimate dehydrogenase
LERATPLARDLNVELKQLAGAKFGGFEIVVNATPVGTKGLMLDESVVGRGQLDGTGLAYDLVYNPVKTKFLAEAQAAGCETIGGLEMLIRQAATPFELWTGHRAPRSAMQNAAEKAILKFK